MESNSYLIENNPITSNSNFTNYGFGKAIVFGEHFVVHGMPAFVLALPFKTFASIEENCLAHFVLVDNRPKSPGFVLSKTLGYNLLLNNILMALKINQKNFTVTLTGNLPVTCGGIGSSAACAVAIVKAFNQYLNLKLSNNRINDVAFFADSAIHGTPSGIDNTAALFGGAFKFYNNKGVSLTKRFSVNSIQFSQFILVDSGKQTDTKNLITDVRSFLNGNPKVAFDIFKMYKNVFYRGMRAVNKNDLYALGDCMNENHKLLQQIGVSCSELNFIVETALNQGALGAKLTGTGGGGVVLILTPNDKRDKVAEVFRSMGYFVLV